MLLKKLRQRIFDILTHFAPVFAMPVADAEEVVGVHGFGGVALFVDGLVDVGAEDETVLINFWAVVGQVAYASGEGKFIHDITGRRLRPQLHTILTRHTPITLLRKHIIAKDRLRRRIPRALLLRVLLVERVGRFRRQRH